MERKYYYENLAESVHALPVRADARPYYYSLCCQQ